MYLIRERFFALGEDITITDERGRPVLRLDGRVLSLQDRLVLSDPTGRTVAEVRRGPVTELPSYHVVIGGRTVARVCEHPAVPFPARFSIDIPGPDRVELAGSPLDHEFTVERGERTVATVSRRWLSAHDTYAVDVATGEDGLLVLASVLALDLAHDREREHR